MSAVFTLKGKKYQRIHLADGKRRLFELAEVPQDTNRFKNSDCAGCFFDKGSCTFPSGFGSDCYCRAERHADATDRVYVEVPQGAFK